MATSLDHSIYCGRLAWKFSSPAGAPPSILFLRNRRPSELRWPVGGKRVLMLAGADPSLAVDNLVMDLLIAGARLVKARYGDGRLVTYDPRARSRRSAQ